MKADIATAITVNGYLPLAKLTLGMIGHLHPPNSCGRYEFAGLTDRRAALVAFIVEVAGEVIERRDFIVQSLDCSGLRVGQCIKISAALEVVDQVDGRWVLLPIDTEQIKQSAAMN